MLGFNFLMYPFPFKHLVVPPIVRLELSGVTTFRGTVSRFFRFWLYTDSKSVLIPAG